MKLHDMQKIIVTPQAHNYIWLKLRNITSRLEHSRSKQYYYITTSLHVAISQENFRKQHIGLDS